ncbi:gliding motility lipoprotein GldH [Flavobacterium enshiense]|uniref:gliding motility lipoprotein GldH n=1 Tax=Flavobacterium enshiense TaxID=1341165 RepID=UPI00345DA7FC
MTIKHFIFLGLLSFVTSCDKTSVYSKMETDFESNRWTSDNTKTFDFAIEDDTKTYTLNLKFSHVYDYQYASVPLKITLTGPDGKEEQMDYELKIKDAAGKQLAECGGDVCDLIVPFKENVKLSKGTYKVTFAHAFQGPYLPNVLGVGLDVKTVN